MALFLGHGGAAFAAAHATKTTEKGLVKQAADGDQESSFKALKIATCQAFLKNQGKAQ